MKKQANERRVRRAPGAPERGRVQYTVRDVPAHVDRALRRRATDEGKSLNSLLREALAREAGGDLASAIVHHDLDTLAGTWDDDPEFDRALADQDRVEPGMWR